VQNALDSDDDIPEMVKESAELPSLEAMAYRAMKAHGMHLRIRSAKEEKSMCDSAIAVTFLQPQRGTEDDENPTLVPVEYIGLVEEILKLNYIGHCVIILLCSWVKAKTEGPHVTEKRDDYGFTLAKIPRG
jgi:hypothetical protein